MLQFILLSLLLPFLGAWALPTSDGNSTLSSRAPSGSKSVIIQMFGWSWASVASECEAFIGPAGYGFVQVSPPAEHASGDAWWTDYQPVSYILTSKRGNRAQFADMIKRCKAAGVGVIVDTILNHMSNFESGKGSAGSSFTHYNYPGIYQTQDFHHCGLTSDDDIKSYTDAKQIQTCELDNLADLATETEYVRSKLAAYANDLLSLGADGLRLDAAKHIAPGDIANILGRLSKKPYITQEVIFGSGEPVTPAQYTGNGDVQEFRYTNLLRDSFKSASISGLQNLDNRGWVPSNQANVFVANHDTERDPNNLSNNSPNNAYVLATIFSLAHPYGTPTVLSSFDGFGSNKDAGAPNGGAGTCSGTGGSNGWLCQHRWVAFSGMVAFRNAVGSAAMNNWQTSGSSRIAFGRGSVGFVAINTAADAWSVTLTSSLPAGTYCDLITGKSSSGSCTGSAITVASGGSITVTIPARSAIAIYTGAKGTNPPASGTVQVTFKETATTTNGQNIFITGSVSQLSSWTTGTSIALSSASYPVWTATISLPANTKIEYKFLRKEADGSVTWESGDNRVLTTGASGTQTVETSWK